MQRPATMATLDSKTINSRYATKERVGGGGFGTIYRGTERKTGTEVAIKMVLIKQVARGAKCPAEEELCAHRALRGIRGIVDFRSGGDWKVGDLLVKYSVMPMAICSLEKILQNNEKKRKNQAPLRDRVVVLVGLQLLETVREMHSKGWLHRDLKCENLLVFAHSSPVVQVCDFGFATQFRNRRGVRVAPTPLPEAFSRVAYVSPGIARKMESTEMDDLWMATYAILRMAGYQPWYSIPPKKRIQIKDLLADNPRSVLQPEQLYLVPFVRKISAQANRARPSYQECLEKLANGYRKSRSDRSQLAVKSTKSGGYILD